MFDYNRAEVTALKKTFESFHLPFEDEYLDVYQRINHGLWQALEKQEIKPDVLRLRRLDKEIHEPLEGSDDDLLEAPATLIKRLKENMEHFEETHPTLTLALSQMLTVLSNAGI